jgi:hypothetical protein
VELRQLLLVTSLAIRLGFASKLSPGSSSAEDPGRCDKTNLMHDTTALPSQQLAVALLPV